MEKIEYLTKMKQTQEDILGFLEDDTNLDYQEFFENINLQNIKENPKKLKEYLHLISNISNHHFRTPHLIQKVEKILDFLKDDIKQSFSNFNIFNIFKDNKRILLYLLEEEIIKIDKYIVLTMTNSTYEKAHYYEYFFPELISFLKSEPIEKTELFEKNRRIGENDDYISKLIQNDSVEEFITYVNQANLSLTSEIKDSIFETNPFLNKNRPTFLEYSAFYGSIQIFQFLYMNKVKLTPSIWSYAIHGKNPDMIHMLEESEIKLDYKECFIESIKCHHNDIANYVETNFLQIDPKEDKGIAMNILSHFNFGYFKHVITSRLFFFYLLINDYPELVEILLKTTDININKEYILKSFVFFNLVSLHLF